MQDYTSKLKKMPLSKLDKELNKEKSKLKKLFDQGVDYVSWAKKVNRAIENIKLIESYISLLKMKKS